MIIIPLLRQQLIEVLQNLVLILHSQHCPCTSVQIMHQLLCFYVSCVIIQMIFPCCQVEVFRALLRMTWSRVSWQQQMKEVRQWCIDVSSERSKQGPLFSSLIVQYLFANGLLEKVIFTIQVMNYIPASIPIAFVHKCKRIFLFFLQTQPTKHSSSPPLSFSSSNKYMLRRIHLK